MHDGHRGSAQDQGIGDGENFVIAARGRNFFLGIIHGDVLSKKEYTKYYFQTGISIEVCLEFPQSCGRSRPWGTFAKRDGANRADLLTTHSWFINWSSLGVGRSQNYLLHGSGCGNCELRAFLIGWWFLKPWTGNSYVLRPTQENPPWGTQPDRPGSSAEFYRTP